MRIILVNLLLHVFRAASSVAASTSPPPTHALRRRGKNRVVSRRDLRVNYIYISTVDVESPLAAGKAIAYPARSRHSGFDECDRVSSRGYLAPSHLWLWDPKAGRLFSENLRPHAMFIAAVYRASLFLTTAVRCTSRHSRVSRFARDQADLSLISCVDSRSY